VRCCIRTTSNRPRARHATAHRHLGRAESSARRRRFEPLDLATSARPAGRALAILHPKSAGDLEPGAVRQIAHAIGIPDRGEGRGISTLLRSGGADVVIVRRRAAAGIVGGLSAITIRQVVEGFSDLGTTPAADVDRRRMGLPRSAHQLSRASLPAASASSVASAITSYRVPISATSR